MGRNMQQQKTTNINHAVQKDTKIKIHDTIHHNTKTPNTIPRVPINTKHNNTTIPNRTTSM